MITRLQYCEVMRAMLHLPVAVLGLFLVSTLGVYGQTWTGASNQSWTIGGNWTGGVPTSSSTITLAATATNYTLSLSSTEAIAGIDIANSTAGNTYNIAAEGGTYLEIGTGGIANSGSGSYTTSLVLDNVELTGNQSWTSGVSVGDPYYYTNAALNLQSYTLTLNSTTGPLAYNYVNDYLGGIGISGSGAIAVTGSASVDIAVNGNTNTFSGGVTVNGSGATLEFSGVESPLYGGEDPLGTGTLTLTNGELESENPGQTLTNNISLNGTSGDSMTFAGSGGTTFSGALSTSGSATQNLVFNAASYNSNNGYYFTGAFTGTAPVTVTGLNGSGNPMMTFDGSRTNTYSGTFTVGNGAVVQFAMSGGTSSTPVLAVSSSSVIVQTGGTLSLGSNYTTSSTNGLTLAGGTFSTNGYSTALGTLTLTGNSTINLGNASSVINFADSSSQTWTSADTLTIAGWNGSLTGGGDTQIYFGNAATGLTSAQLAEIVFVNPVGLAPGTYGAQLLSTGELVPMLPEPSTVWMGLALIVCVGLFECRRRRLRAPSGISIEEASGNN